MRADGKGAARRLKPFAFLNQIGAPFQSAQGRLSRRALIRTCSGEGKMASHLRQAKTLAGDPGLATAGGTPALQSFPGTCDL